ncbi:MAG: hypothetical protein V4648_03205 [Bacteroidota bacterium]
MKPWCIILFLILKCPTFSQENNLINGIQYGATAKVKIEISPNSKNEPLINFRISASLGLASTWITDEIYPSVNGEIQFYNGGLGSRTDTIKRQVTLDGVLAFTLTGGHLYSKYASSDATLTRNVLLRYFSNFAIPSLQNPYNYSFSLGTNLLFSADPNKQFQRVGFLNINHSRLQLSYYNDGMPFQYVLMGDDFDRYHTGGGIVSYDGDIGTIGQFKSYHFELSYHKFSGFSQNSFELANSINLSNVDYNEPSQIKYNKSLWKFSVQSLNENNCVGIALSSYNSIPFDGQHLIHWLIDNAFHIVPYKNYFALEPSYAIVSNRFKN